MTDMNFDMKKALRRSCEAVHDRSNLIVLLAFLVFWGGVMAAWIAAEVREGREAKAELARLEAVAEADESAVTPYMISRAKDAVREHESSTAAPTIVVVILSLVLGPMALYYGWSLWYTCRRPEAYEVYEATLVDPAPAMGRGMVSMTAVYVGKDGQKVRRETRGIFQCSTMCWYNDMTEYNNQQVLVAYDPAGERLAVLGRKEDLPYDASNENL